MTPYIKTLFYIVISYVTMLPLGFGPPQVVALDVRLELSHTLLRFLRLSEMLLFPLDFLILVLL